MSAHVGHHYPWQFSADESWQESSRVKLRERRGRVLGVDATSPNEVRKEDEVERQAILGVTSLFSTAPWETGVHYVER